MRTNAMNVETYLFGLSSAHNMRFFAICYDFFLVDNITSYSVIIYDLSSRFRCGLHQN
jgi:hypothetical protein